MASASAVKDITNRLESGIQELFESDKYAAYLQTMSRFHRYSTRNTLLIHMQRPDATQVAGFRAWQDKFKRQVKKGEKSIKIFAPTPFVTTKEMEKIDPVTQRPIIGDDGNPVREQVEIRLARFRVASVFDVSQTEGEPLPTLAENISGNVSRYELFMDALRAVSPLPISFDDLPEDTDGICHYGDRISIRNGMSEVQTVAAVIHEITHAKLHSLQFVRESGEEAKDRRTEEVEAESVSYSVAQYYGIDTGANSFGYIAEWSRGRELKELNTSLDTIRKATAELIDGIDEQYRTLAKERGIDLSIDPAAGEQITLDTVQDAVANETPGLPDYSTLPTDDRAVGTNVLMPPVFNDGNFNREGRRIRVTVEEPAGKYQLFSRDDGEDKALYFLTASGRIDSTREYFRDEWNEESRKWESHLPTETELDEVLPLIAAQFERDMADPVKWAKYQHAAVVNRLGDCEAHNIPVRKQRDEEDKARLEAERREEMEANRRNEEIFDARVDEIAEAIKDGKTISVGYDEYLYEGKNPVLDLFRLYGVELPLRTQGWVNTGLAELSASGYRYYKSKTRGNSTVFNDYFNKLREAIQLTPIVELRQGEPSATDAEVKNTLEHKLFDKFAGMFPNFMSGKCSYLRLESESFEPLSLEWIDSERISVMHTYKMNGDTMYDPMVTFDVDRQAQTMTAHEFEQSMPPLYQRVEEENGDGLSVDGNGNQREIRSLQGQINSFSQQWFSNIGQQGFMPVRGTMKLDGEDIAVTFDMEGNVVMPEPEVQETPITAPNMSLPDPSMTVSEALAYGYSDENMLPLSNDRAAELFDTGHCIYLLYPDNSEAMALDRDEIKDHDGLCGIEKVDWERSPLYAAQIVAAASAEGRLESDLLHSDGDCFGIYQLKSGDETRDYRFESVEHLEKRGLSIDRANYELIYTAPLAAADTLDSIYTRFNLNHPAEFTGHSLSVSDVVVLKKDDSLTSHYVDDFGFTAISSFTGNERSTAAPQAENIYSQLGNSHGAPTVSELEAEVKAGKSISLMDLSRAIKAEQPTPAKGKPSLLGKLEENKQRVAQQGQPEPRKADELEV